MFILALVLIISFNLVFYGALYLEAYDSNLYISIAENFLENGNFIQTSRPFRADMIVPPGLPFILTVILGVAGGKIGAVVTIQYVLYALTAVLVIRASTFIFADSVLLSSKKLHICYAVVMTGLYSLVSVRVGTNPVYVLTEIYVAFIIAFVLYLFLSPRFSPRQKIYSIMPLLFFVYLIRPACSGLLIIGVVVMALMTVKKQIKARGIIVFLLVVISVLGLNTWVNYCETGHIVMLENYGATDVYIANNSNTKATWYSSNHFEEFVDEDAAELYYDESISSHEKNERFKEMLKNFCISNPLSVLKISAIKYFKLFFVKLFYVYDFALAALILFARKKLLRRDQRIILVFAFLVITAVPAFGLLIIRYSAPAVPFLIVFDGGLLLYIGDRIQNKAHINELVAPDGT